MSIGEAESEQVSRLTEEALAFALLFLEDHLLWALHLLMFVGVPTERMKAALSKVSAG